MFHLLTDSLPAPPSPFQKRGITLHAGCHPTAIEQADGGAYVLHYTDSRGEQQSIIGECDGVGWVRPRVCVGGGRVLWASPLAVCRHPPPTRTHTPLTPHLQLAR